MIVVVTASTAEAETVIRLLGRLPSSWEWQVIAGDRAADLAANVGSAAGRMVAYRVREVTVITDERMPPGVAAVISPARDRVCIDCEQPEGQPHRPTCVVMTGTLGNREDGR